MLADFNSKEWDIPLHGNVPWLEGEFIKIEFSRRMKPIN